LNKKSPKNSNGTSLKDKSAENPAENQSIVINECQSDKTPLCEVKCQKCGEKTKLEWKPGMLCPVCGSKTFLPIIKVDNISEQKPTINIIKLEKIEKKLNYKIKIKKIASRKNVAIFTATLIALVWIKIGWFLLNNKLNKPVPPANLFWEYVCGACEYNFIDKPQIPPLICPVCGKKEANMVFYCIDCKTKFPLSDKSKSPRCPKCSSNKIIAYRPNIEVKK